MDSIYDPKTQEQIQEFHERLQTMSALHRKAVIWLSADRLMRDFDIMREPPRSRSRVSQAAKLIIRAGVWVKQMLDQHTKGMAAPPRGSISDDEYDNYGG